MGMVGFEITMRRKSSVSLSLSERMVKADQELQNLRNVSFGFGHPWPEKHLFDWEAHMRPTQDRIHPTVFFSFLLLLIYENVFSRVHYMCKCNLPST
jgi:hypothetical protein